MANCPPNRKNVNINLQYCLSIIKLYASPHASNLKTSLNNSVESMIHLKGGGWRARQCDNQAHQLSAGARELGAARSVELGRRAMQTRPRERVRSKSGQIVRGRVIDHRQWQISVNHHSHWIMCRLATGCRPGASAPEVYPPD